MTDSKMEDIDEKPLPPALRSVPLTHEEIERQYRKYVGCPFLIPPFFDNMVEGTFKPSMPDSTKRISPPKDEAKMVWNTTGLKPMAAEHNPFFIYLTVFPIDVDAPPLNVDEIIKKHLTALMTDLYGPSFKLSEPTIHYSADGKDLRKRFFSTYRYEHPIPSSAEERDNLEQGLDILCQELVDDDLTAYYHFGCKTDSFFQL